MYTPYCSISCKLQDPDENYINKNKYLYLVDGNYGPPWPIGLSQASLLTNVQSIETKEFIPIVTKNKETTLSDNNIKSSKSINIHENNDKKRSNPSFLSEDWLEINRKQQRKIMKQTKIEDLLNKK